MVLSFLRILILFSFVTSISGLNSDGLALLALKAAIETDPTGVLDSWSDSDSDSTPCHWPGIVCTGHRVTDLYLPNKGFNGYIPSELGLLNSLKRLSLPHNNFSKLIPAQLFNATNLIVLDLSHNSLFGPIPDQITELKTLSHLDFSSNLLNGSLPQTLPEIGSLVGTLNLSYNRFSGEIPPAYGRLPVMVSLDLRHNNLTGKIPQVGSLLNQGPTAFAGNPNLCGFPLESQCPEAQNPKLSRTTTEDDPQKPSNRNPRFRNEEKGKEEGSSVTVPIISGVSVVIGAVSISVWLFRRKLVTAGEGKTGRNQKTDFDEGDEEGQKGKFVVMDEGFSLELEDLLRASAYVVGKSRSGIVYRVVAGAGRGSGVAATVVAVRRLSEGDATWRFKEFESEMEAIGRVHHPNIVRLRAYYYAHDEKLLISDFVRNGSLYSALHGRSDTLPPLTWAARLKISQGTARGLMYIHEHSPRKYVHGSIKSTKILLDDDLQPYISGFGLTRLISGSSKKHSTNSSVVTSGLKVSAPSASYVAPEARIPGSKFTQKCDVFSFGIVLLEILTGRVLDDVPENDGKGIEGLVRKAFREERPLSEIIDPSLLHEFHAKKQVVAAFHIALNCTEIDPELRPKMKTVSESLDRIKLQ